MRFVFGIQKKSYLNGLKFCLLSSSSMAPLKKKPTLKMKLLIH